MTIKKLLMKKLLIGSVAGAILSTGVLIGCSESIGPETREGSSSHCVLRIQFTSFRTAAIRRAVSVNCCTSSGLSPLPSTLLSRYDSHFLSTW